MDPLKIIKYKVNKKVIHDMNIITEKHLLTYFTYQLTTYLNDRIYKVLLILLIFSVKLNNIVFILI